MFNFFKYTKMQCNSERESTYIMRKLIDYGI